MTSLVAFLRLARLHQHVKNIFVLLPLFFAGGITDPALLWPTLTAFIAFSFAASGIYVLNDWHDREEDRVHPAKKDRPLAAGTIQAGPAIALAIGLLLTGLILAAGLSLPALGILGLYVVLNLAYSFHLKQFALIDVTLIASGFALRLFMGSCASSTPLSHWIVVTTFLLALFLALAKRRDDLVLHARSGEVVRIASQGYSIEMLNSAITLVAASVIVAYLQYTTSEEVTGRLGSDFLYLTTFFVVMGILRYLQMTFVHEKSGSPTEVLLRDRFTQINLLCWAVTFGILIYT
jgi:4-hydroxybenzoate polyprenyltransferase